jgi:hypothetical protein
MKINIQVIDVQFALSKMFKEKTGIDLDYPSFEPHVGFSHKSPNREVLLGFNVNLPSDQLEEYIKANLGPNLEYAIKSLKFD